MIKAIYEIFEEFEKTTSKENKIEVLRKNTRQVLKDVLQGAFHPSIKFTIKEIPNYKSSNVPVGMGYSNLDTEISRIYLFTEGSKRAPATLTEKRKNEILIQILESLESKEAKIFSDMLMKNLKVKGLTYKLVQEAFPGLLP